MVDEARQHVLIMNGSENFDDLFAPAIGRFAPVRERLSDVYRRSPEEALEVVLKKAEDSLWKTVLLWTSSLGLDGVHYGSYKNINRRSLEGRKYKIEFWDYMVSIHFTDVRYNPRTFKNEPV